MRVLRPYDRKLHEERSMPRTADITPLTPLDTPARDIWLAVLIIAILVLIVAVVVATWIWPGLIGG